VHAAGNEPEAKIDYWYRHTSTVRVRELRVRVRFAYSLGSTGIEGRMMESKVEVLAALLP
jgi:hypothetical protein